jgi:hypothetical protein
LQSYKSVTKVSTYRDERQKQHIQTSKIDIRLGRNKATKQKQKVQFQSRYQQFRWRSICAGHSVDDSIMLIDLSIQPSSTKSILSFNTMPDDETMMASTVQPIAAHLLPMKCVTASRVVKNKTANFFTRFFSSLASSHANNDSKTSAPPMVKGVFAIQSRVLDEESLKSDTISSQTSLSSFEASTSPPKSDRDSGSNNQSIEAVWLPSTSYDHNKGLPLVVRRPQHDIFKEPDDRKLLKIIMGKAKKLPQTSGKFACNHIMVNTERIKKRVPPLTRYRELDRVARDHARSMADEKMVRHMAGKDNSSDRQPLFCPRWGVNIARGNNVGEIHKLMMANLAERNNVLDKRFTTLGMGTARADDGMIYLCQIFGGH